MRYRAIKPGFIRRPFGNRIKSVEVAPGEEFELPPGAKPGRWMVPVQAPKPPAPPAPAAGGKAKPPAGEKEPVKPPVADPPAPPAGDGPL